MLFEASLDPSSSEESKWQDNLHLMKPRSFNFSKLNDNKTLTIRGILKNWKPLPLKASKADIDMTDLGITESELAVAFLVQEVPYRWKFGRLD